jgi:hypothetical protein
MPSRTSTIRGLDLSVRLVSAVRGESGETVDLGGLIGAGERHAMTRGR